MHCMFLKKTFFIVAFVIPICISSNVSITSLYSNELSEKVEDDHIECYEKIAELIIDMLVATRGVIAKNQELINRDPATGNYSVKGFVPAVVGSQVANDFSLMTGHRLKQTSLKIRNPSNAPDKWERKVLKLMESPEYPRDVGFGEFFETNGAKSYRYMKPIYVEIECLQCHGNKRDVVPAIKQFLERRYPFDKAFGYKKGDFRGGISINISLEHLGIEK